MKVILTKGMQASSKSTWATKFIEENQDYKRINRDSLRHMLSNYTFDDKNEKIVTNLQKNMTEQLIKDGYNLIVDEMNLSERTLNKNINFIKECHKKYHPDDELIIEIKEFPITLTEAIERDSKREFSLGKSILKKTWNRYEIELKQMIEKNKPKYDEKISLPSCIICDIDGTLSNSVNRKIYDGSNVPRDLIIKPVKSILKRFNPLNIILFSGRSDRWYDNTVEWLEFNHIPYDELYMRKEGDNRCDTIVKSEMFEEHIRNKYYCDFVIDDRKKVLDMWINKGLFVFDVSQDPYCKNNF